MTFWNVNSISGPTRVVIVGRFTRVTLHQRGIRDGLSVCLSVRSSQADVVSRRLRGSSLEASLDWSYLSDDRRLSPLCHTERRSLCTARCTEWMAWLTRPLTLAIRRRLLTFSILLTDFYRLFGKFEINDYYRAEPTNTSDASLHYLVRC